MEETVRNKALAVGAVTFVAGLFAYWLSAEWLIAFMLPLLAMGAFLLMTRFQSENASKSYAAAEEQPFLRKRKNI